MGHLPRLLVPLALLLGLAGRAEAQFYTVSQAWRVDAAGVPLAQGYPVDGYEVLNPPSWIGFQPRISSLVYDNSPFAWNTVTVSQVAGPAPLFGPMLLTNGVPGCNLVANSDCANLPPVPTAGIYTGRAVVDPGLATGDVLIVVGGGSDLAVAGTQVFQFNGVSTGVDYSYGLSLGDVNPVMRVEPGLPLGADGSAFAAAFAADINGGPGGYTAMAVGPTLSITAAGGAAFRLWVGDGTGKALCQVTGGVCEFNPEVRDITGAAGIPTLPPPAVPLLVLALLAAGTLALRRRVVPAG